MATGARIRPPPRARNRAAVPINTNLAGPVSIVRGATPEREDAVNRSPSTMQARAALCLAVAITAAASRLCLAAGGALRLTWTAPTSCPDRTAVVDRVTHLVGRTPQTEEDAWFEADVTATDAGRWRAVVRSGWAGSATERRFESASCTSIASATALIIAMIKAVADAMLVQLALSKRRSVADPAQPLLTTARHRPASVAVTSASNHASSSVCGVRPTRWVTRSTTAVRSGQLVGAVQVSRSAPPAAKQSRLAAAVMATARQRAARACIVEGLRFTASSLSGVAPRTMLTGPARFVLIGTAARFRALGGGRIRAPVAMLPAWTQ